MNPVSTHGAVKITMDTRDAERRERLNQARAQGDGNPHIFGIQAPHAENSTVANMPITEPGHTSGNTELGTSATKNIQQNPDEFQAKALEDKLAMYKAAAGNAYAGMNDRSRTGRIS